MATGEVFISRENMEKLGIAPATTTLALTLSATEYAYTIPEGTKRLIFGLRSGSYAFTYGWATGVRNITVPAGSYRIVENVYLAGKILYVSCADAAGQTLEIEYWQ